jgi:hypothetical protein
MLKIGAKVKTLVKQKDKPAGSIGFIVSFDKVFYLVDFGPLTLENTHNLTFLDYMEYEIQPI